MAESSIPDAVIFGWKVKLQPLLNSWSGLFRQLELNALFFVIRLPFGSLGVRYPSAASFTSKFLLLWASFS
jgi:hypothetical protein